MSDFNNGYARPLPQSADMSVDAGLRAFMLGVYNKLALGLVVAGALAYVTGNVPAVQQLLFARRLSAMNFDELHTLAPQVRTKKKVKHGHLDEDAIAFAIYTTDGKMVLHDGENGPYIPYHYRREGFDDGQRRGGGQNPVGGLGGLGHQGQGGPRIGVVGNAHRDA